MRSQFARSARGFMMILLLGIVAASCASTQSTRAATLTPRMSADADLRTYRVATVTAFDVATGKKIEPSVGLRFATDIATRLQKDFGELFADVRTAAPLGNSDEIVITGLIKTYRPGSRFGRAMMAGLGSARFEGDLIVKRATDGSVVLTAPFNKLWAWGGVIGASKGIEEMVAEAAAAAANTVARAKGWQPSTGERAKPE